MNPLHDEIDKIISSVFDVPIELMYKKTRRREVVEARQTAMFIMYHKYKQTKSNIARRYGHHHATVFHALSKVADEHLLFNKDFRGKYARVWDGINSLNPEKVKREIVIHLTQSEYERLENEARYSGISVDELVRQMVRDEVLT